MTKTSHSKIYSTESGITGGGFFKTHPLHFTKEQLEWIENIQFPFPGNNVAENDFFG